MSYDAIIEEMVSAGPGLATANIDESPESGAEAMKLHQLTGVPALTIYSDLDTFRSEARSAAASALVAQNSKLSAYIRDNVLGSVVSNDDYDKLSIFSDSAGKTARWREIVSAPRKAFEGALTGAAEGFGEGGPGSWIKPEDREKLGAASTAAWTLLGLPIEAFVRGLGAGIGGVAGAVRGGTEALTGDAQTGISAEREVKAMFEAFAPNLLQVHPAVLRAKQYLDVGQEPPRGIHPQIDAMKAEINAQGLSQLEADLAAARTSATKERSVELFQQFARQHYGDTTLGISGDTVALLYKDRLPTPDDGLLGWVPGIADKLELARETGADVHIPIADWVSRVDPALAKVLHDDIRMWPGGVTVGESKTIVLDGSQYKSVVDAPLAEVRDAGALEPAYAIGDRKLTLRPMEAQKTAPGFENFRDFDIVDQAGQPIGWINVTREGKTLYINQMDADGGPMSIGPAAMRDLLRQLKAEFPDADTITGHRVSGARGESGAWQDPAKSHPKVKFDLREISEAEYFGVREVFDSAWEREFAPGLMATVKPTELYTANERAISDAVNAEIRRIAGDKVEVVGTQAIDAGDGASTAGVYIPYRGRDPIILYDMLDPDAVGVGRHEAIHLLKRQNFFTQDEWGALVRAAMDEGWLKRYDIENKYVEYSKPAQLEESIAEAYRDWAKNRDAQPDTPVTRAFQKMYDLWEAIKGKLRELFGRDVTFEELFQKIDSGEIAARGPGKPSPRGEIAFSLKDQFDALKAEAAGLDLKSYKRIQALIEARYADDLAAATKRAEAIQKKSLTKEWREELAKVREEVHETILQRPDIAADMFLSSKELYGKKLEQAYHLASDDLTEAQREALPKNYFAKEGLPADDVAALFGFPNKDAMIERLLALKEARGDRPTRELVDKIVREEAARVMQQRHGNLDDNIMDAARDQALSDASLNLLAEEVQAAGMLAKTAVVDKAVMKGMVDEAFAKMSVSDVSSENWIALIGKHGRDAERALIAGDPAAALQSLQRKQFSAMMAKEMRAFERDRVKFDKLAARYQRPEVRSVDQEFTDHIQRLLSQAGYRVRLRPEDIQRSIDFHGQGNLTEFTAKVADQGWDPVVSPELQAVGAKEVAKMTVSEFEDFKNAVTSLNHIGREVDKINVAGAKQAFADFRTKVLNNISQLPARPRDSQGKWIYNIDASLTRMEELVKDLDLRQELGPLWEGVIHPMVLSKSKSFDLMSELSTHFQKTKGDFGKDWRKSLGDTINHGDVIWDPYTQAPYDLTRENLIQIMLNWGNRSNIDKYVKGAYFAKTGKRPGKAEQAAFEGEIKAMIDRNARKEDWDFVQRMWEPFKGWQSQMDTVARNTSGVAPKWIDPTPVVTPHGTFDGGYWPVKYDRLGSNIASIEDAGGNTDKVFGQNYFRAATSKGYLKERTGYVDFVDISTSLEQAAGVMQQTIHDIAFRDALIQGAKVFYDPQIRAAIRKHYGEEYEKQLIPWLKRISYQYSTDERAISGWNDFLRRARLNLVGHALPLNLRVILSPDVGTPDPRIWAKFEANRAENMKLAMEKSAEIKHLVYNLDRDYREALDRLTTKGDFDSFRRKALEWGYWLPSKVSQEFRAATFVDVYGKRYD